MTQLQRPFLTAEDDQTQAVDIEGLLDSVLRIGRSLVDSGSR